MSNSDQHLIAIYRAAYNFLKEKVDEKVIRKQLDYYKNIKPKSLRYVFLQMIRTLKNKQGYVNFIADPVEMKAILYNYNPVQINIIFRGDWKKLFKRFKRKFGKNYKMKINDNRNSWVMYSRGVLSCAKFLSNFKNAKDFDKFIKSFFHNEFTVASLPMLLEKEIFGFGFPLACDFVKELGYVQYGKPDVHIKDIFQRLKIVNNNSDYESFKMIVRIGILTNEPPVIVDKIFWLIGSGNFYSSDIKIGRQKNNFYKYLRKNKIFS